MFRDRADAGERLARGLNRYAGRADAAVLAVPRGGLPVAEIVARELNLPLDVVLTKKIGHPEDPESAMGAVSLTGVAMRPPSGVPPGYIEAEIARLRAVLRKRDKMYRGGRPAVEIAGRTVILVDDGAATGMTLLSAVELLRQDGVRRVVIAVPVASRAALEALKERCDEFVCLGEAGDLMSVSDSYRDFAQVTDEQAVSILRAARS
ncbi:MAG TPA: phosphoribosyltransferase [Elusimicrobia bacterium]|nr:MAG: hypothetical protein A2X37_09110 [Elusimicrobia bacterium GWA2_66_18]OGR71583.1 MAG: hypothetical protein A2X40_05085 [Elusimicrobia bacterium GWC2_65_9]HAZ08655.1 phosphoribosyltransferase [Elusimicrobiota bacterium]